MIPTLRYASTLRSSISDSAGTIVVNSLDDLQGKSSGGVAAAALAAGDFLLLRKPHPDSSQKYIQECVEITTIGTPNADGSVSIDVNRADGTFSGTPEVGTESGVWELSSGALALTQTASTNYSFLAGTSVENCTAKAKLRLVSAGATADDAFIDYDGGAVSFINVGNTTDNGKQVDTGMKVSFFGDYRASSAKRIHVGLRGPQLQFQVDIEHQFQDGRYLRAHFHKAVITPENVDFEFQPTDWVSAELLLDLLRSTDAAHETDPTGWIDIDNDPITQQPVTDTTQDYTAGVFRLYLTPISASAALWYGIPVVTFDIGNIRIGGIASPQEFLEHLVGIPQDLDAKIQIRRQFNLRATVEEFNARNVSLLFGGKITDRNAGWAPIQNLITVSSAPVTPGYTVSQVKHSVGRYMLNVGA